MEALMKNFIRSMSKEDKQKMIQEFMNSMNHKEKAEMIQLIMPIMMKDMNPSMIMTSMANNFDENDCEKTMKEIPSEDREKCKNMMTTCLRTLQEMEKTTEK